MKLQLYKIRNLKTSNDAVPIRSDELDDLQCFKIEAVSCGSTSLEDTLSLTERALKKEKLI